MMSAPIPMTTMNLLTRSLSVEERIDEALLCANVPSPLSSVAFHQDVECIRRSFAAPRRPTGEGASGRGGAASASSRSPA